MKKHILLAFLFLSFAFRGWSQHGDRDAWTVTNTGTSCTYYVCLELALQNTSTLAISSSQWICNSIAPGNSATFSMLISPATGYQIVVIDATATYGTTTLTGLSLTGNDIRSGACNGGSGTNWVTWWAYTGTHSFSIHQDLVVGK